jgi:hypothetical protein
MARTTIDIDSSILHELKRLQQREGRSLGAMVSELLAEALARRKGLRRSAEPQFDWVSRPMQARVDVADTEALWAVLDREDARGHR